MYILINEHGEISLQEDDNLRAFSIIDNTNGNNLKQLDSISEPAQDNHYWINADAVIQLSSKNNDPQWVDSFWKMLKAVEPYGYADIENKRIKAHIESTKL